jgi:hypothetical protein
MPPDPPGPITAQNAIALAALITSCHAWHAYTAVGRRIGENERMCHAVIACHHSGRTYVIERSDDWPSVYARHCPDAA